MQASLPVKSQLNVQERKSLLIDYSDQQLLQLLAFGFSLDFNRNCPLKHEGKNGSSAIEFSPDVDAYTKKKLNTKQYWVHSKKILLKGIIIHTS